MNQYEKMKIRHQNELDSFPFFVAFTGDDFKRGLRRLGLKENDSDKISYVKNNVFIKKEDLATWNNMFERHKKEMEDLINNDKIGTGFIYDMFLFELINHEYGYTGDITDTIKELNFTEEEIKSNPALEKGLKMAIKKIVGYEKEDSELEY